MKLRLRIVTAYIPALVLFVLLSVSCKKSFLERDPYAGLPTGEAIRTIDDMETALNGTYAVLRNPDLYGRTIPLIGDLLADNVYISPELNSNRYLEFMQVNYTVNNGYARGIWQAAYNAILNANNVIHSSIPASQEADQFRGEALSIRALMYFELVKHFSRPYTVAGPSTPGVPIILNYDPFKKPARNTLGEVYDQIEKDLTDAIPMLTFQRSSGYFTEYAAKGLLARLHQFKGEWNEALTIAEDVIGNSGYNLLDLSQFSTYWSANTARTDGLETLFEVVFDLSGNAGIDALPYFYDQEGYGDALASDALYNIYSGTDFRRQLILTSSPTRGDVKVANKYPNSTKTDKDEIKVLRLSEMYLIAAEAAYNKTPGNEALARAYLNEIAMNRDPAFAGYTSTGATLLNDILRERRKELAFEGHRYWDLVRYNLNVVRIDLTGNNYPGALLTINTTNFRRILPIPQTEVDANPSIRGQQNSGY